MDDGGLYRDRDYRLGPHADCRTAISSGAGINITMPSDIHFQHLKVSDQIVKAFTVSDFSDLFSKRNMLALIIFATLVGISACMAVKAVEQRALLQRSLGIGYGRSARM